MQPTRPSVGNGAPGESSGTAHLAQTYAGAFFDSMGPLSAGSAERLVPLLIELTGCQSVVDVGCGDGAWLKCFSGLAIGDYLGIDGPHVGQERLKIPKERFVQRNLECPYTPQRRFDLALSLEVAEHLPDSSAEAFIDTLTACADVVVFSAAVPGQGGTNHVNEQPPEYWAGLFATRGYQAVDCIRPIVWNDRSIAVWYRQNTLLYARPEWLEKHERLNSARATTNPQWLNFVHPDLLAYKQRLLDESESLRVKTLVQLLGVQKRVLSRAGPALIRSLAWRIGRGRARFSHPRKRGGK